MARHLASHRRILSLVVISLIVAIALVPTAYARTPARPTTAEAKNFSIQVLPINKAKLLVGQRFDFRVEANGIAAMPYAWSVVINGQTAQSFYGVGGTVTNASSTSQEQTFKGVSFSSPGTYDVTVLVGVNGSFKLKNVRYEVVGPATQTAKNVILFVADGLSTPIRTAARIVSRGMTEGKANSLLAMDDMDVMSSVITSGMDSIVTDSANSASAYTTGNKSAVNALGVYPDNTADPNDDPRVETLAELVKRKRGMSVGVVTTSEIQDATPAAVYGHTRRRSEYVTLTDQLLALKPEVILGGGGATFLPKSTPGSRRSDEKNMYDQFGQAGYKVVNTRTEMMNAGTPSKLLGIFHLGNMNVYLDKAVFKDPKVLAGNTDQPMLWEMTQTALKTLSQNKNGFFLMVEGASIDKQAHPMDWERTVWDTIEMDKAVQVAKDWAKANGNETLIIVLADHAHGMSITGTYWEGDGKTGREAVRTYQDAGFPTYVDSDGDGFPDKVAVDRTLAIDWANHPDYCDDRVVNTEPLSPAVSVGGKYVANPTRDPNGVCYTGTLPQSSGSTEVHTVEDVPLTASGPGASLFRPVIDNTEVFFVMARALGLDGR